MRNFRPTTTGLLLLLVLASTAQGQTATRVGDFANGAPSPDGSSNPRHFFTAGGKLFFSASESTSGEDLYATDGSGVGTERLADICPGACGFGPIPLAEVRGVLLVVAFPTLVPGFWCSDGTRPGTFPLTDTSGAPLLLYPAVSGLPRVATLGGFIYFEASDGNGGRTIWRTDGTQAGTRALPDLIPGLPVALFAPVVAGDRLYFFTATPFFAQTGLWASDSTAAGTRKVAELAFEPVLPTAVGARLLFVSVPGEQLWASDGTPAGTQQVSSFVTPHPLGDIGSGETQPRFRVLGGRAYFVADDGSTGFEIWSADGTPSGTRRVTDISSGGVSSYDPIPRMELAGNRLVFKAFDSLAHLKLWTSDGSPASTARLADVTVSLAHGLFSVGGKVLFVEAPSGDAEARIWVTDGTPGGTAPLAGCDAGACTTATQITGLGSAAYFLSRGALWRTDGHVARRTTDPDRIDRPASILSPLSLGLLGNRVFFAGKSPDYGTELWVTTGTPAGSRMVANLDREVGSGPHILAPLGNHLLFSACSGGAVEILRTDGTAKTTVPLATGPPCSATARALGTGAAGIQPRLGDTNGSTAFFLLFEGEDDLVLWKSDGTPAGTAKVDTVPLSVYSRLAAFGGRALFTAPEASGTAIWSTDGTPQGTAKAFSLPTPPRTIEALDVIGSEVYLMDFNQNNRHSEAWRSDGTPAGTRRLTSSAWLLENQRPSFVRVASTVFFIGQDEATGIELWETDGTPEGTARVLDLTPGPADSSPTELTEFQGALYFFAATATGRGLWRSDGTAAGTVLVKDFYLRYPHNIEPAYLKVALGQLFFVADDGVHGAELWQSDGTPSGTVLVKDILPGPASSQPFHLTEAGGRLFFTALDGVHGVELWQTDGHGEGGTRLVQDIAPAWSSSDPVELTAAGDRLYFVAADGLAARDLWSLPLSGPAGCQPADTRLCLAGNRFQVEIAWRDFQGHTGRGHAVALTAGTGYFWFFDPANVETVVKVLDARALNQSFWVFYGALSSVEYAITVTDTATGLSRGYFNPAGNLASVGDTHGFGPFGALDTKIAEAPASGLPLVSARTDARAATGTCVASPGRLCLQGNRFAVTAAWKDFSGHTGTGTAVALTGDTGYFWFFSPTNVEVVTKVLDGRGLNDKFWVFYGALSNVEYTLTVTDTQTGAVKTYKNPLGQFGSVADTGAF